MNNDFLRALFWDKEDLARRSRRFDRLKPFDRAQAPSKTEGGPSGVERQPKTRKVKAAKRRKRSEGESGSQGA